MSSTCGWLPDLLPWNLGEKTAGSFLAATTAARPSSTCRSFASRILTQRTSTMNSGRPVGRACIRSSYSSKHLVVPEKGGADGTMASETASANLRNEKQATPRNLQQKGRAGRREGGFRFRGVVGWGALNLGPSHLTTKRPRIRRTVNSMASKFSAEDREKLSSSKEPCLGEREVLRPGEGQRPTRRMRHQHAAE
jgi:hypothetical protein